MSQNTQYRVFKLSENVKSKIRMYRSARRITNEQTMTVALTNHLAEIIGQLEEIGIGTKDGSKVSPVRLPLSDVALTELQAAATKTGLSQNMLLNSALIKLAKAESIEVEVKPVRKRVSKTAQTAKPTTTRKPRAKKAR